MAEKRPKIFLSGVFRVEDLDGSRVEIRSSKAEGILALLASAPKGERSRLWLQSKLWSDRAPEQASGSLRQCLTQLRRVLTPAGINLATVGKIVSIDRAAIEVVDNLDGEFLEGLDICDQEFEEWLATERNKRCSADHMGAPPTHLDRRSDWRVSIATHGEERSTDRWFETLLADALCRSLREYFSAPVSIDGDEPTTDGLIHIRVENFLQLTGKTVLRVHVDHPARRHQVWAGHCEIAFKGAPQIDHPDILKVVNQLIEAIGDYLIRRSGSLSDADDPDSICRQAIRDLFSMDPHSIVKADASFARAFDLEPRGLFLAWRAQLRAIQTIERHNVDTSTIDEEGLYFCAKALELEPSNSMVLAALSNSLRRFDRDDLRSLSLAQRSVQLNPSNPMGWWALCAANSYVGDENASLQAGIVARNLAILSPDRFWWDNQRFVPSLLDGDLVRATELAEQAHSGNPNFRPPLRHLIALYANGGRYEEAVVAAEKLKVLEKDFEVGRLLKDSSYPASILRRARGLNASRIQSIS